MTRRNLQPTTHKLQAGFSLVELMVASAVFAFVVTGASQLFATAIDLQRRASGIQKIEENAQFAIESIAKEVRVSKITSGDTVCDPADVGAHTLVIEHPVHGIVTYTYDRGSGTGIVFRDGAAITSTDVDFKSFAFCVSGTGADNLQTRLTMPMTIESMAGRPSTRVSVSLQTTVVSRDLSVDLAP